jgi:G3E family GTPase
MELLVVAGFLGSGKTTMIISTIGSLIERTKKKVVVIVNDFGKIGIDGKTMDKYGLKVQELSSGCICCTLGPDFIQTLKQVAENFKPDIVVVEPTGIADPESIINSLGYYHGPPVSKTRIFVIVDAVRFSVLIKALERPLKAQIKAADVIIINKIDEVDETTVGVIKKTLTDLHVTGTIITASATNGTNLDKIVDLLVS